MRLLNPDLPPQLCLAPLATVSFCWCHQFLRLSSGSWSDASKLACTHCGPATFADGGLYLILVTPFLRETKFLPWWFRLLGAAIDADIVIDSTKLLEADLVSIGSGSGKCHSRTCFVRKFLLYGRSACSRSNIGQGGYVGPCATLLPFPDLQQGFRRCTIDGTSQRCGAITLFVGWLSRQIARPAALFTTIDRISMSND